MLAFALCCSVSFQLQEANASQLVATIEHGGFSVGVHARGVIVHPPSAGLVTVDGPRAELHAGDAEWFGLSYRDSFGQHEGVGSGFAPDWAKREEASLVAFDTALDRATSRTKFGALELRHEFFFDPDGADLVVDVRIRNSGRETARDVFYTREWRSASVPGWSFPSDYVLAPAPPDVARRIWMVDDIPPGLERGLTFAVARDVRPGAGAAGVDVPLSLWTSASHPNGVIFGNTNGISFGDYDADGYPDVFAARGRKLWRNVAGADWLEVATTTDFLPIADIRYGASFGDYDDDGLNDIGTEPRAGSSDHFAHLGHNLGGAHFEDVAGIAAIYDLQPSFCDAETWCWADVDGDRKLDAFLPTYPPWAGGGPGNFFHHNLGPVGPGGAYAFEEISANAGLDNPPGTSRPEGAQFVDVDGDGDLDLFSNGTLYRNRSSAGSPSFERMQPNACGITISDVLDEGALFFDYDLDGDFDLATVYSVIPGVRIWRALGDGTFGAAPAGTVQSPLIGLDLGLSAEDWDNDGDLDLTTRHVFRRNLRIETGQATFSVATHAIPPAHLTSATPAWGDWDKDGDLDCALGNWLNIGRFYVNTLYGPATPMDARRYIRVEPRAWSLQHGRALQTEYGTSVEVRLRTPQEALVRRKFTASSAGYLNQNEYALHFALPGDPDPNDPALDVEFDVLADFPVVGQDAPWRVDRFVNPRLGSIALASLASRDVKVFRAGEAVIDGLSHGPSGVSPQLVAAAGGLMRADAFAGLPALADAPNASTWVSLAFETAAGSGTTYVSAVDVDGQIASTPACGGATFDLAMWDVTDPLHPTRLAARTADSGANHRSRIPFELALAPGRQWRCVAHVAKSRATPVALPIDHGRVRVLGSSSYSDLEPCNGHAAAAAPLDPTRIPLSVLFHQ